jgi:hypothetical protein
VVLAGLAAVGARHRRADVAGLPRAGRAGVRDDRRGLGAVGVVRGADDEPGRDTGALTAGPAAHAELSRRWVAAAAAGLTYVLLGALAPVTAAVVTGTDERLVTTAAGLGLLGALIGAVTTAWSDERSRTPAAVTLLVAASGVTVSASAPRRSGCSPAERCSRSTALAVSLPRWPSCASRTA